MGKSKIADCFTVCKNVANVNFLELLRRVTHLRTNPYGTPALPKKAGVLNVIVNCCFFMVIMMGSLKN